MLSYDGKRLFKNRRRKPWRWERFFHKIGLETLRGDSWRAKACDREVWNIMHRVREATGSNILAVDAVYGEKNLKGKVFIATLSH